MSAEEENLAQEDGDTFSEVALDISSRYRLSNEACEFPPRRFRNNSYHRAVGSSEFNRTNRNLAVRKRHGDPDVQARALLYQQLTERGLEDTMDEDDDENSNAETSSKDDEQNEDSGPLWSNLSSVRNSKLLETISSKERKRQEAMYEVYTSEQSYLRSLKILDSVFMKSESLRLTSTKTEFHHLFSNLQDVLKCSTWFLADLEKRFKASSQTVKDICDIITDHISNGRFDPYITYCSNEVYQQRAFQNLLKQNSEFVRAMKVAESHPSCMSLPLHSFLLLPMQRVTRLPLLVDGIRQRCDVTHPAHRTASLALKETSKLVNVCNEQAKYLQRTEDMIRLQAQLEFKTKSFALVSHSRFLLKRGKLIRLSDETILGFRKLMRQECHVFLFNDVIITAKKKSDDKYTVSDFCYRHRLRLHETDDEENAFQIIMEKNQDKQRVMMRLQAESPNACARWVMCVKIMTNKEPQVVQSNVQVKIVKSFRSDESDQITLQPADVLCVLRSTSDGWYYGERIIDKRRGWFPSTHAKEILNEKIKEKNFKRGTRMLCIETEI